MDLQIEGLRKTFGGTVAVDDVSLRLEAGSFVAVIGRSGAGKSTLLRLLNRLVPADGGRILHGNEDVLTYRGARLRTWRRQTAMIFQQFNLVDRLDVLTNVLMSRLGAMPLVPAMLPRFTAQDTREAIRTLHRLGLASHAEIRADQLSGGQQQRVAIARALMQEPKILLADEPIASLDPHSAQRVLDTLRRINREDGLTVLCNLHSVEAARETSDRIVALADGRVVFDGPPGDLTDERVRVVYGDALGADASTMV